MEYGKERHMDTILKVTNVGKSYRDFKLSDMNFEIKLEKI